MSMECSLLQCILGRPALIGEIEFDLADAFLLSDHRKLWRAAVALHSEGLKPDIGLLAAKSGVDPAVIGGMFDAGAVSDNFSAYVRRVREAHRERRFRRLYEELGECAPEDRPRILEQVQELSQDASDWRRMFHTIEEFESAPKLEFAIKGFLQEGCATFIAGLSGHSKTLFMLAISRSLLTGKPLFGYFEVPRTAERVFYLIPESTIAPFWSRIKLFHLEEYVRSERLYVHTLSAKERIQLTDPRLLAMVSGGDIFLDTAARFMTGGEDIEDAREFANSIFGLLRGGARSITAAHHSPKEFAKQTFMCLENVVRGSGDLGAALGAAWGLRQIDPMQNRVYVQNVKPRDFQPCEAFIIEGRPHLDDTGYFLMTQKPGKAGDLGSYLPKKSGAGGRPVTDDKVSKLRQALDLRAQGQAVREIAKKVGVGKSTVDRWFFEYDLSQNRGTEFRDSAGIGTG